MSESVAGAMPAVSRAIAVRSREFEARFAAGDAAGLVRGYFVPDELMPMASPPGGQPPVKGHAGLIEMFTGQVRDVKTIRLETLHVDTGGDIAYELGLAHLQLRAGPTVMGRYTVLWKRVAEEWRAQIDFFAADGWQK